jgi:hypothetical protein
MTVRLSAGGGLQTHGWCALSVLTIGEDFIPRGGQSTDSVKNCGLPHIAKLLEDTSLHTFVCLRTAERGLFPPCTVREVTMFNLADAYPSS